MANAPLIGSAGGAGVGFLFGGPVGAVIGGIIGHIGGKRFAVTHGMTPERKKIFEEALKTLQDPISLRKLADGFEKAGLNDEANLLRSRAALRELPPEQKAARKKAFQAALSVGKKKTEDGKPDVTPEQIDKLEKMASAFQSQGATGNAAALRKHVEGLRKLIRI